MSSVTVAKCDMDIKCDSCQIWHDCQVYSCQMMWHEYQVWQSCQMWYAYQGWQNVKCDIGFKCDKCDLLPIAFR